ncbi:MAG: ribosome-associated translation inhibitor RaiA [bacterium]
MRIDVRGRNLAVTDELREAVAQRFARMGRQVSEEAILEVGLREERNPAIADSQIAEATVHVKGVTLRASEASPDMVQSIHLVAEDMSRQVKKYREKRRDRWRARRMKSKLRGGPV